MKLFSVIDRFYFSIWYVSLFCGTFMRRDNFPRRRSGCNKDTKILFCCPIWSQPVDKKKVAYINSNFIHSGRIDPEHLFGQRKRYKNSYTKCLGFSTDRAPTFIILQLFDRTNDIIIYFYWITLTLSNFPNDFFLFHSAFWRQNGASWKNINIQIFFSREMLIAIATKHRDQNNFYARKIHSGINGGLNVSAV